uniref:Uncharacterized protein n=1 Tax=Rhizophora mucronata TaxID=61149 RepID=A0A2P2PY14_RHIMU
MSQISMANSYYFKAWKKVVRIRTHPPVHPQSQ